MARKKIPAAKAAKTAKAGKAGKPAGKKAVRAAKPTPEMRAARKAARAAGKGRAAAAAARSKAERQAARRAPGAAPRKGKPAKARVKPAATLPGHAPNSPTLSPYLTVADAAASLDFYGRAFGFKVENEVMKDKEGRIVHAGMRYAQALIMFSPEGGFSPMKSPKSAGAPVSLHLYVYTPDVDAMHAQAVAAGAQCDQAPADQFWGDRTAIFTDIDGYIWTFATNTGPFDPTKAPF